MATIMTISDKELKKKKPKAVMNPNLDEIIKIIRSPEFKSVDLTPKGQYSQLSAGLEIDWNPKDPKSWKLSFLFVPDMKEDDHSHLDVSLKKVKELHKLLGNIISATDKLAAKKKKKKTTKSKKGKK